MTLPAWKPRRRRDIGFSRRHLPLIAMTAMVVVSACSSPSTPPPAGDQIVVVGDSYTTGPNDDGHDPNVWPTMVWNDLRNKGYDLAPTVSGEGGAGYVKPGYRGGTFPGKAQVIQPSTDLVVFFGSANDMFIPTPALTATVHETLKRARLTAPQAHLLVIGPAWPFPDVPPLVWRVRDIVRSEATAIGATFVDPLEQRWLWDDPTLIGPDKLHPDQAGQRYLAEKIGPLVQAELPAPRP